MSQDAENSGCCSTESGCCGPMPAIGRRDFLKVGLGSLALLAPAVPAFAGPFTRADFAGLAPTDKRLSEAWLKSLTERGEPTVYHGAELEKIGMPVGGIGAGQLYLGGDGKLWHWDIFNHTLDTGSGGPHYEHPPLPESPLEHGFALQITAGGKTETRALDHTGFSDVRFQGQYPIGTVEYADPASPVAVTLEAFSPFIPLNTEDSSLPATVLQYTLHNTGDQTVDVTLSGRLENAVCLYNRAFHAERRNRIVREKGFTFLDCSAARLTTPEVAAKPNTVIEDWDRDTYAPWTVEGTTFGKRPLHRSEILEYQGDVGGEGDRMVNGHSSSPGKDVASRDDATGKLTGPPFTIDRNFIQFWIGGGSFAGRTCMNLIVDGKVVRTATGRNDNHMSLQAWDVHSLLGKEAHLEIVDTQKGGWGHIAVGRITGTDRPAHSGELDELPDWGTMGLALVGAPAELALSAADAGGFTGKADESTAAPLVETLIGAVGRKLRLRPGQSRQVTFVLAWHFRNLEIPGLGRVGRHYGTRFESAQDVARYVADHLEQLGGGTRLWRDTWYDSSLPYWFLDRTLATASVLATSTAFRLASGRFYAWEGVGCCAGTCTHVWHYAHGPARLFPELERDTRERVDFGFAFNLNDGVMGFRAEFDRSLAVDGQTGTLLRAYREHQMSPDDAFLKRNWPRIRQAYEPLLRLDGNEDGVLEGAQMNTLDQPWHGKISWLSSLYLAALRAGAAMAGEMGEQDFAERCTRIADRGARNIDKQLFNGEYYYQVRDLKAPHTAGSYNGCEIDQVFGDSWARQVGLKTGMSRAQVKQGLRSIWKYNFTPDMGPFRAAHKPGRWYAMAGEAGTLMCSWPKGEGERVQQGFDFYFNECFTGNEHQVAGHMLWEGLPTEALAVVRAVHDRYHAARRNPYNEVECGDHYARSMASYGVYTAACGYEHHGPQGHLGFAPRLTPESFKAAFTAAEGWGSYAQTVADGKLRAEITPKWGRLRLKTLALGLPANVSSDNVQVKLNGRAVKATSTREDDRLLVTLGAETVVKTGQRLEVSVA